MYVPMYMLGRLVYDLKITRLYNLIIILYAVLWHIGDLLKPLCIFFLNHEFNCFQFIDQLNCVYNL